MRFLTTLLLFTAIVFSSCQTSHESKLENGTFFSIDNDSSIAGVDNQTNAAPRNDNHFAAQRDLIRTAFVKLDSENLNGDKKTVLDMCNQFQGFIHSENSQFTDKTSQVVLGISIPKQQFDPFMYLLDQQFPERNSTQISTVDVTDQLVDLNARIKSKQILEQRLFQLIEKTADMTDVLSLEESLNRVRQEIERMQAQTLSLQNQVAISKINITITKPFVEQVAAVPTFGDKASNQFLDGWSTIKSLALLIIGLWPVLIIGIVAAFGFKLLRKRLQIGKAAV